MTKVSDLGLALIRRALISVTDKSGLPAFALGLAEHGVELISTGGTAKVLRDSGLKVIDVAEVTGFPEMMDGRVKTLNPIIHGGILGRRGQDDDVMQRYGIQAIDLVVVNLYAFKATVAKPGCAFADAVENIDIGGPALIRASAKNHQHVAVVTDISDYPKVMKEMAANGGNLTLLTRQRLAAKAFRLTNGYDGAIADYLEQQTA